MAPEERVGWFGLDLSVSYQWVLDCSCVKARLSIEEMGAYQIFVETPLLNQVDYKVAQRCHNASHHDLRPW